MDETRIRKARVHPVAVLAALLTYKAGRGFRGKGTWAPVTPIIDALDDAFYMAFGNVEPMGKRVVLALDVSASMDGNRVAGIPFLDARVGSAAMALVTLRTDPNCLVLVFSDSGVNFLKAPGARHRYYGNSGVSVFDLSARRRLDDVAQATRGLPFGGTDCSLPMQWALANKHEADAFVIYTDSETWSGDEHPCQSLREYREKMGIAAKQVVVGMTATGFTVADPSDAGTLDVVGFDTAAPNIISDFVRGA